MNPQPTALPPLLIPRPASLSLTGGTADLPEGIMPAIAIDPSLPRQDAYRLTISPSPPRARISHRSPEGLRHARRVLTQLRAQYARAVPALEISDHPALAIRGVMLDVSRDRIPTMAEFARLIPELASLGFNHLQLYTEHTFAYAGHEEVWGGWSPVTPEELATIEALCREHGIDLAPNQNCFGHLSRWLAHPRYAPLAETHGEWIFDRFTRSGPFSLCPIDPGSIVLVRDLLSQLLPRLRSPWANVGCDETYDVGQGRSRDAVASRGKGDVYFRHVAQVFDAVRAHGKRPLFWGDVAMSHPECVRRIPGDSVALIWGYERETDFDRLCAPLCDAGKSAWVCPGTSSWRSITGRTGVRRANLDAAARAAARRGLQGMLVTDWGDAGHRQVWPIALAALAEAGDRAWNAGRPGDPDPRAIALHCFADRSLSVAGWLDELGDVDAPWRARAGRAWFEGRGEPLHNASVHFADLSEAWGSDAIALDEGAFRDMLAIVRALRAVRPECADGLLGSELDHTLDRAELACRRGIVRRVGGPEDGLIDLARQVSRDHERLWVHRSRSGRGLGDSVAHDIQVVEEMLNVRARAVH